MPTQALLDSPENGCLAGHLHVKKGALALNPDIAGHITRDTPPTFLLQNEDDDVDTIWDSLAYYAALIQAQVPVEFHSYAEGGHAFGLRRTKYQPPPGPISCAHGFTPSG